MATLIQSKQIQGVVTASVIQGDFLVSGSLVVSGSGIFTQDITASGVISASRVLGVNYDDISGTPNFVAGTGISISQVGDNITITNIVSDTTGSDSQTLSIVGDQLTISGGNTVTIPTGIGGGGSTDISSLNTFTSSAESRLSALESATGSYLTSETDSQTLSIVGDQLTISSGNTITIPTGSGGGVSSWNDLTDIPSGLVSGSSQLTSSLDTRYVSSTDFTDYTFSTGAKLSGLDSFTSSIDSRVTALENTSSSHVDISSLNQFTSSIQTQVDGLSAQTSSYLTELPIGLISGSYVESLPSGLVSSSEQVLGGTGILSGSHTDISSLNDFTSSYLTDSASFDSRIDSIVLSGVPAGTISGSSQLTSSFDTRYALSGSTGDTSFDGNRIVSNTLLGDLYSQSFNAGTSGSIQEFLTAVFFPSEAPTATFSEQTSKFNTNLATNNTNLVSVSLTDTVDNSPYTLVLSGTNASSFTAVPTNAESSSWEIRANGNLTAGTYSYNVVVGDSTDAERTYSGRSITIAQATSGTLTTNGTFYIIESATTGPIYLGTNGRSGTQGLVSVSYSPNYGSQVATNFSSSNPLISVNSTTGVLSVGTAISGSGNVSGDTITSTISWEDQYGNSDSDTISVNVTTNFAPTRSATSTTNNNTNQATGSAQIIRLTIADTESDTIPNSGLVWDSYNSTYFSASVSSPYMYLYANNTSIPNGTYPYTASFTDVHGFRTTTYSSSVTINLADDGTLGGDINNYIIESAVSGDVLRDATGYNGGNPSRVTVSYSPNYGSQVVQSFTSTNPAVLIDSSGYLTLGVDLSGSVTQSGDTFSSIIGWEDQYGNTDSRSINVTVFGNQSPSATFTDLGLNTDTAVSGSHIGTLTISDTESNTPFSASIGGTDGGKFEIVPQNANSSSYYVYPTGSLSQGDYSVQFVVTDNYSETATLNETISVSSAVLTDTIYVYTLPIDGTYNNVTGITAAGSGTPPEPTISTSYGFFTAFVDNDTLGDSNITVSFGSNFTATLRGSAAGSNLDDILDGLGALTIGGSPASERIFIMIPSGSNLTGVPTSLSISDPGAGSTVGEYVVFVSPDGTYQNSSSGLDNDIKSANIHKLTLDTAVDGYVDWFVIGTEDRFNNANAYVRIVPSSGSVPS